MNRSIGIVAALLMFGVCVRHFTSHQLDGFWLTSRAWFYVLGSAWEALLCAMLAIVIAATSPTKYRFLALSALCIGISEALQMGTCRLVLGSQKLPAGMDTCDYVTGLPIGATSLAIYIAAVLWALWKSREQQ